MILKKVDFILKKKLIFFFVPAIFFFFFNVSRLHEYIYLEDKIPLDSFAESSFFPRFPLYRFSLLYPLLLYVVHITVHVSMVCLLVDLSSLSLSLSHSHSHLPPTCSFVIFLHVRMQLPYDKPPKTNNQKINK